MSDTRPTNAHLIHDEMLRRIDIDLDTVKEWKAIADRLGDFTTVAYANGLTDGLLTAATYVTDVFTGRESQQLENPTESGTS